MEQAVRLLRASISTTGAPADLLARDGNQANARAEQAAALMLAPNFVPARRASTAALQSQQLR